MQIIYIILAVLFIGGFLLAECSPEHQTSVDTSPDRSSTLDNDVRQAKNFLDELPPACRDSSYKKTADGGVRVNISCSGTNDSMEGVVKIKNGVVDRIR